MGALMADADSETQARFYKYGENLGLAFQLQDDYLDTYGDPATFGKAIGDDILNDKKTWLLITALNEDKSGKVKALLGQAENPLEKIEKMREGTTRSVCPNVSTSSSPSMSTRPSSVSTTSVLHPRRARSLSTSLSNLPTARDDR